MKKILGVSIAAMLAVTPMLASAAGTAPTAATTSSEPYLGVSVDAADQGHIASTAYVKGAYNAAIGATNAVSAAKQDKLMNNDATAAAAITGPVHVAVADANSASDTALVTEKAVRTAIDAVSDATSTTAGAGISKTNGKIAVDMTANGGLQMSGDGDAATLGVKVNATTLEVGADGVGIKAAGVDTTQLADDAVTNDKIADNAVNTLQIANDAVTTAKILDENVTTGKLAAKAVTTAKIDDGAVTGTQLANGAVTTAKVDGTTLVTSTETWAAADADDTKIPTAKAVETAINSAVANQATQAGVNTSIQSAYVSVYDAWGADTYKNVNVSSQGYQTTAQTAPVPQVTPAP